MTNGWSNLAWRSRPALDWTVEQRLLGAYLLSGPASNRLGCFHFSLEDAARETGIPSDRVTTIITEFQAQGFAKFDSSCGFIWIPEVLERHPFADANEVRIALPVLAAVPRSASFRAEFVQAFRASADRPGATVSRNSGWLHELLGDDRAQGLAERMAALNARLREGLPGLPLFGVERYRGTAGVLIILLDYLRRWRAFLLDLVNTPALRFLGILTVAGAILFVVFPSIDLGVASWFFHPPRSFFLGETWIGRFFDNEIHFAMEWFLVLLVAVFLVGLVRKHPYWGLTPRNFLFVALSIGLGAGLLTNVILKDSWGRARPSQVMEFGGSKQFSPPFMRSTQCHKNCSFVSGDASLAASFMAFAVIARRNRVRWWLGLGSFSVIVGVMRMSRGSHFLSDVIFAIIFTLMIMLTLSRLILEGRWRDWPRWRRSATT